MVIMTLFCIRGQIAGLRKLKLDNSNLQEEVDKLKASTDKELFNTYNEEIKKMTERQNLREIEAKQERDELKAEIRELKAEIELLRSENAELKALVKSIKGGRKRENN
jgi:cell division protein FtsB